MSVDARPPLVFKRKAVFDGYILRDTLYASKTAIRFEGVLFDVPAFTTAHVEVTITPAERPGKPGKPEEPQVKFLPEGNCKPPEQCSFCVFDVESCQRKPALRELVKSACGWFYARRPTIGRKKC